MTPPTIVRSGVYPVAGHDSMELNLSGAHAPYFTRNVLVLEDSVGNIGVGEVPGAYCPGDWSVNARGERKLMGLGQRLVRGAAHTGGVIVVGGSDRVRAVLGPVYAELGLPFAPDSAGAIEDEVGPVTLDAVRDALLAELAGEYDLRAGALDPALLEHAARFESSHRIPQTATH